MMIQYNDDDAYGLAWRDESISCMENNDCNVCLSIYLSIYHTNINNSVVPFPWFSIYPTAFSLVFWSSSVSAPVAPLAVAVTARRGIIYDFS